MTQRRFWLFKTEPSAFSIDDLAARPEQTEQWDGVRNYQARNLLRDEVAVGDGVLVYHSNIPDPAVVGMARVVRAGYPDRTAWDPTGIHFDPGSSPDNPRWYMVDVRYVRHFSRPVTLAALKFSPELQEMVLLKRSRLSIQPVSAEEWRLICAMAGDSGDLEP